MPGIPAVFLDRDGTINEQMGYVNHEDRFVLLEHAAAGIRALNQGGVPVVMVTNQSGLARGYFPPELLEAVHAKMRRLLGEQGAHVDAIYVCPHHPEAKEKQYRRRCRCRKPRTGLLKQAAREMGLDLARSFLVGDRWSDLVCGADAGCTPVLVTTGYGKGELRYIGPGQRIQPAYVAADLLEAARWILDRMAGGG